LSYESKEIPFTKLYMDDVIAVNDYMSLGEMVVIALGCLLLVVASMRLATKLFSDDARRERRRRRNNARISTKASRPMVKFSVKAKKDRRK